MASSHSLHILKLEISHGSDRHEISLYSNNPPTVAELLNELEKKTRVPLSSIQLIFKGQKLHFNPNAPLVQFGIFSGSRLLMVGEKLNATNDATFRRILGIGKDVGLVEKTLNDAITEFTMMQNGVIDRSMVNEYLPQLHQRVCVYKKDLETFLRIVSEIQVDINGQGLNDIKKNQDKIIHTIQTNIGKCNSTLENISKLSSSK